MNHKDKYSHAFHLKIVLPILLPNFFLLYDGTGHARKIF